MKGAEATIVGAYNTTAYVISYEPTSGGKRIEKHKWVIHEELIDPQEAPLAPGTEIKRTQHIWKVWKMRLSLLTRLCKQLYIWLIILPLQMVKP